MTPPDRRRAVTVTAIVWLMTALMPFAGAVRAQETTGTIAGTVRDNTGGVLPGVQITAISTDTGQTRETVTNSVGQYRVVLPVGNYQVNFRFPNFRLYTLTGVSMHVNDRRDLSVTMNVGAVETVTVRAVTEPLVQRSSAVQTLIPQQAIRELPSRTRTLVQFATLVPGASSDLREDTCFCDQGNLNISFNGARRSANNWLLDGANNVSSWNNYTSVTTPSLEALEEINVMTSSHAAEFARNGGGVVNAVTKSGANRFSGSAYEFLRNDALNANTFFRKMDPDPEINSKPPRLRYNNFGYTLGGPALPARKRLFFFFSEEWRRSSRDRTSVEGPVPDPAWLTDPGNRNYVPPEARDPNALALLSLWPAPNVPGTNRYRIDYTNELDTRQELARVDHYLNGSWSVTGRYLHDRVASVGEHLTGPQLQPGRQSRIGQLGIVETRRGGGRVLYELSYQASSHRQRREGPSHTRASLGIQIPEIFPENTGDVVPNVNFGVLPIQEQSGFPRRILAHTLSSALTITHDAHSLKAGGLVGIERSTSDVMQEFIPTQGSFVFVPGGGFTAFQNFARGNAARFYFEADTDTVSRLRSTRYELYAQDTWRIHPSLTLDLGLRYALYPAITEDGNRLFAFSPQAYDATQASAFADPSGDQLVDGTGNLFNGIRIAGKNSPYGRALYRTDTNNLQPRFGAAWGPGGTDRMVVRAGYGMYFDQTPIERFAYIMQEPQLNPFRTSVTINNAPLSDPARGSVVQASTINVASALGIGDQFIAPRWQHWNIGVQRRLYSNAVVDVGYVGGRGDHLLRYVNINQPQPADLAGHGDRLNTVRPYPGYSEIFMQETTARSRYRGLVVGFRQGTGRAGFVNVNYTLSRNEADASYDFGGVDDPQNPLDPGSEFDAATTDRTHIFNVSYVYEPPFVRTGTTGWRGALLGGWQLAGVTWIESGPAARLQAVSFNYDGTNFPSYLRPDQVGAPAAGDQDGLLWFDPAAFVPPAEGAYGGAPVAAIRLPGRHQWDFALSKTVPVAGAKRLQFRVDVINAFNQAQFLDVDTECVGATSCTEFSPGFGRVTSTRPPREIQLGARLDW